MSNELKWLEVGIFVIFLLKYAHNFIKNMWVDLFQEWVYFREITVPTCYFDILMLFIVLRIEFKLFFLQYSIEECFIKNH